MHDLVHITPTQLLLPLKHIYFNHNQIQKKSYPQKRKLSFHQLFHRNRLTQANSRPVSKQLTPTIKQSTLNELPNSDKGKFTTKNKYILTDVQQPRNEIPAEKTKKKKRQLKTFQGTQLQESVENQFELKLPSQRTKGREIKIFTVTFYIFYHFCNKNLLLLFHQ